MPILCFDFILPDTTLKIFAIFSAGSVVLYTGVGKFITSIDNTLDYAEDQAKFTSDDLKNVSIYLDTAKTVAVNSVFLPSEIQQAIDSIDKMIKSASKTLNDETSKNSKCINIAVDNICFVKFESVNFESPSICNLCLCLCKQCPSLCPSILNMTYEELVSIMHTVVKYDVNKHSVDLQSISIIPGTACRMLLRNDDDVQFMLGEDREIPQVCVSLTERATQDVIGNDIPPGENTQQFGSASSSNQVFTQKSATEGRANMCVVPPVVVDHADIVEPQFGDVFGCRIEMNDGQYNKQYNEMNNNMYNEQNTKPNLGRNEKVDNKTNIDPLDHLEIIDEVSV
ncbi:hypothetical protein Dsin_014168 [Dipteronia sinensis]|uniref:Uncharacterized protein n=1 Tax=Dipteronia sinensis TaxID=43782 RepID=A0AAE0ALE4_9ROSI|nr:hypothetical protein Dsin_014168 [Dipteronia sinensis]